MAEKNWRESATKELKTELENLTTEFDLEEGKIKTQSEIETTFTPPAPKYYWWGAVFPYCLAQVVLGYFALIILTELVVPLGIPINVGVAILLLQVLHFVKSLRSIGVDDLAGFSLFGRPWFEPKPGLYLVPWGILKLIRADRNYKDMRFPGPADKIFRVSKKTQDERKEGGDMPPEDRFRPIFVMTGEPRLTTEEKSELEKSGGGNPLDRQLSVEISYFVRYRPDQKYGGIFRIARNLSAQTENINQRILDLIQEQSERDIKAVLSRHTPATIVENWDLINKVFVAKIRLAVMRLGINVDKSGGGLDDLNPSRETNEDQAEVTRELFKKLATITRAEAKREELIRVGEGTGRAEQLRLEGLAKGYKKIMEDAQVDGASVIASETVKASLDKTKAFVVGTAGVKELFGLAAAGKEFFSSDSKKGD